MGLTSEAACKNVSPVCKDFPNAREGEFWGRGAPSLDLYDRGSPRDALKDGLAAATAMPYIALDAYGRRNAVLSVVRERRRDDG